MASKNRLIEDTLNTALQAFATTESIVTVFPGGEYEMVAGTSFVQADFLPAEPQTASIGTNEHQRMAGIYQLKIYTDGEDAQNKGYAIEEKLNAYFKKGYPVTYNGVNVQIDNFYGQGFEVEPDWNIKTIIVSYRINL